MCQTPNLNFFPGRGDGGARRKAGDKRGQAGAGSRRGAAGGRRAWASVKLPAPESPPAWAHSGRLFPRLGFGRQPCLSLPGVPNMRQSYEDELVLLLAARLVSESRRGGSTDPPPPPLPQRYEVQTCAAKPSSAGHLSAKKTGTAFSSPKVSECVSAGAAGARSTPALSQSKPVAPAHPACYPGCLLLGSSWADPALSPREEGTNPAPSTQLQPPPGSFVFVCLFVFKATRVCL